MRVFILTALVMAAFAANSLLNRAAVGGDQIGALSFALVRTASGALALCAIVAARRRFEWPSGNALAVGALSLSTYMIGFSLAYRELDAGAGALILFGGVQLTMFAGALAGGERPQVRRWTGTALALAGLAWMVWPASGAEIQPVHAGLMGLAAAGWGIYSLNGRRTGDPLSATTANFVLGAPLCAIAVLLSPPGSEVNMTAYGAVLAVISGAVMSALGYALLYVLLPQIAASAAAVSQLTVPVIALAGGAVLLGEIPDITTVASAGLVLGGVALGTIGLRASGTAPPHRTSGSRGS